MFVSGLHGVLDALELQVDSLNESRVSDSKEEGGNNNSTRSS